MPHLRQPAEKRPGPPQKLKASDQMSDYLKLPTPPSRTDLILCNANDVPPEWESDGHRAIDLICDVKPDLVIIDSMTAFCPDIEEGNSIATRKLKELRGAMRTTGCSINLVHHVRKPSDAPGYQQERLQDGDLRRWFLQTRGPRSLINGSDLRLGVDVPTAARSAPGGEQNNSEPALVLRGFRRLEGEIPTIYLARFFGEDGAAIGYGQLTGASLLFNSEQQETLAKLPAEFATKEARQIYGKGAEAVNLLLNKCVAIGILRNVQSWLLAEDRHIADRPDNGDICH
jgi:hypothetical protein